MTKQNHCGNILFVPQGMIVGVDCGEGPPVPIPNTAVKLTSAENTWVATPWEDREMPTLNRPFLVVGFSFCITQNLTKNNAQILLVFFKCI